MTYDQPKSLVAIIESINETLHKRRWKTQAERDYEERVKLIKK